jgi:hypothetical protein
MARFFLKKKLSNIKCVFLFSLQLVWNISHSKKKGATYYHKCICFHVTHPLFVSDCNETNSPYNFRKKNPPISNFMKIRPMEAEGCHVYGRLDRSMLILAIGNFANSPKNSTFWNVIKVPQLWALQIHVGTFHIVMHQIPTFWHNNWHFLL